MKNPARLSVRVLKCFIDHKCHSLTEVTSLYNSRNTLSFMSRLYRRVIWRKVTEENILRVLKVLIRDGLIAVGNDATRDTSEELYTLTQLGTQRLGEMNNRKK